MLVDDKFDLVKFGGWKVSETEPEITINGHYCTTRVRESYLRSSEKATESDKATEKATGPAMICRPSVLLSLGTRQIFIHHQ